MATTCLRHFDIAAAPAAGQPPLPNFPLALPLPPPPALPAGPTPSPGSRAAAANSMTVDSQALELFVPGRLCLFGEHRCASLRSFERRGWSDAPLPCHACSIQPAPWPCFLQRLGGSHAEGQPGHCAGAHHCGGHAAGAALRAPVQQPVQAPCFVWRPCSLAALCAPFTPTACIATEMRSSCSPASLLTAHPPGPGRRACSRVCGGWRSRCCACAPLRTTALC